MATTTPDSIDFERHQWLLEQYNELASLAGGLAHEIKNPLSTLSLNLQLLAEDFQQPESQRDRRALQKIETLQRECHRLEVILEDFLRFARVCDLTPEPIDVNEVLREVIEFQTPQCQLQGIVVRDKFFDPPPKARVDRDFFRQAILNLVLNAQQAMPNGGELIVQSRSDERFVYIEIIDTGVGIKPESLAKIFRPFFSTRKGGSGLGLSTTKKIIEAHHGRLSVASEPGKGTAFTIQLPCERP